MTVAELIERLQNSDSDKPVRMVFDKTETAGVKDILYTPLCVYIYNY